MKFNKFRFNALALGLVACLGLGSMVGGRASAQGDNSHQNKTISDQKISPELTTSLRTSKGTAKVILQLDKTNSIAVQNYVRQRAGRVGRNFENLRSLAVEVPVSEVGELATRADVRHISLDRQVKAFGHVTATTGADQIRQGITTDGVGYTVDGTGIGIAVLDSGIDIPHSAFATAHGPRILATSDFTDQPSVRDSYGHGTHVASEISGSLGYGSADYSGIAPGAGLISLRVLNS